MTICVVLAFREKMVEMDGMHFLFLPAVEKLINRTIVEAVNKGKARTSLKTKQS